ncbi:MAG: cobyrinate a,c-diamide synthase [Proteobacteria bacterium]|nr:cobyrinate a,c-diamide synthase [Pseudomonadota bacterium]MBU1710238.1 cobyrinate a,c-diamide synthase [Pseudomonadota bacterium]
MDQAIKSTSKGIIVAGLGGGSGKSVVAVGLVAALTKEGHRVVAFKKGPDYIDSGWLSLAAGRPCYNLDPYLMSREVLEESFFRHSASADLVIMEGNRGLFDGVDVKGSFSTAELAITLELPVLLVVDCTKTTRTIAALVLGCREFDRRVNICGVVLNRVGTSRHEAIVRESVEKYTGIPVLGAIHRSRHDVFPQRHLGVTPGPEHRDAPDAVATLARRAEESLDLDGIKQMMADFTIPEKYLPTPEAIKPPRDGKKDVRIGIIRDEAFQFYYQENFEALEAQGAQLVEINALHERELPEIDALYIGGGFPETSVRELSANISFRESVKNKARAGLPIYAECGGLIYLGEHLEYEGETHPLVGIFPVDFKIEDKPQAHGYTVLKATQVNPFYAVSTEISGHEFRYSRVTRWDGNPEDLVFRVARGVGLAGGREGLVFKNVLALYTHIHAVATPQWAAGLVEKARQCKRLKKNF